MSKVTKEQYIKEIEHDMDKLADMVLELREENSKLKMKLNDKEENSMEKIPNKFLKPLIKKYPNDMELGEAVRCMLEYEDYGQDYEHSDKYIYESPDGKKVYRRYFNDYKNRELVKSGVKKSNVEERLEYLKTELIHSAYHDGWVLEGMREELECLEKELGLEQLDLFKDK